MHVSPGIKVKYRAGTIGAVYSALWDDEKPMAVFAISRGRRVANVLAITDQRVLTFRRVGRKYPLEDSIDGADIADGFVLTTGPNRANASVFIGMDEISLGTVLRVSDAELHYIGALLRWITGTQALEPQVGLHELVTARRGAHAADREAAEDGPREPAPGGKAAVGAARSPMGPPSKKGRTSRAPASSSRPPTAPGSRSWTPTVPGSRSRTPTVPASSSRSPTVPGSSSRSPTVPVSRSRTPTVPASPSRSRTMPAQPERTATTAHSRSRSATRSSSSPVCTPRACFPPRSSRPQKPPSSPGSSPASLPADSSIPVPGGRN